LQKIFGKTVQSLACHKVSVVRVFGTSSGVI
jgi:hypothetical protein